MVAVVIAERILKERAMAENKQEIQSCPSYNPADLTTTAGMLDYIYRCNSMATENCMPAIVEEYDRAKNIVTIKPAINITAATGETIERESMTATVMAMCGGKFVVNFPLEKGDTGWLITADRDISLFREQRKVINANTNRIHSIEDSFFIPDRVNDFKVEAEDEKNLVIQNLGRNIKISLAEDYIKITTKSGGKGGGETSSRSSDNGDSTNNDSANASTAEGENSEEQSGSTEILIREGGIEIKSKGDIKAECKNISAIIENEITAHCKTIIVEAESATIKANNITLDGNVIIKQDLHVEGNIDCDSNITGSAVKAGSIDLAGHVHGGVENGSGKTGGAE